MQSRWYTEQSVLTRQLGRSRDGSSRLAPVGEDGSCGVAKDEDDWTADAAAFGAAKDTGIVGGVGGECEGSRKLV